MRPTRIPALLVAALTLVTATAVSAQPADTTPGTPPVPNELTVSTPYPGVAVEPGGIGRNCTTIR